MLVCVNVQLVTAHFKCEFVCLLLNDLTMIITFEEGKMNMNVSMTAMFKTVSVHQLADQLSNLASCSHIFKS